MDGFLELMSEQNIEDNGPYWDDSQFVSPHEEKQLPHVEASASQKAKKARSKNFSVKEDNMLVSAWLEVSLDAIQGNEQSRATYWQRITDYFHENKDFASDRNSNSLQHRWSIILEGVNRFCGCYVQIQNRRQSGVTEQDKVMHACELYKSKDPKGRSFGLLHCWNILQHEQKWKDRCVQKKQKTSSTGSLSSTPETNESHLEDDGEGHTSEPVVRPGGRKAEKERQRRGKNPVSPGDNLYMEALENMWAKKKEAEALKEVAKKERYDERLALEKKKIELKEQDIALRRRIEDDKVMNMDLSGMSERQRQYYTSLQDEIIARRFGTGSG
ncbi:glutathione S-transferase T3-like [Phragmites australis]|uniref:glutathione S-transferase T3-like n=1 Tax=Phragmites australis TaxID=29695 RepID=UPI002D7A0378|nr:glutathione S-transferase T3-like [Phragmites australis]XP_062204913.1 glutathione S-transferase T3-like [Phragmites australis]